MDSPSDIATRRFGPRLSVLIAPSEGVWGQLSALRAFAIRFLPLLLPLLVCGFAAVAALPLAAREPEGPDCELTGIGESRIALAVERWATGIDDGCNKCARYALFAIWNALRATGIEIFYPHRAVEPKGGLLS